MVEDNYDYSPSPSIAPESPPSGREQVVEKIDKTAPRRPERFQQPPITAEVNMMRKMLDAGTIPAEVASRGLAGAVNGRKGSKAAAYDEFIRRRMMERREELSPNRVKSETTGQSEDGTGGIRRKAESQRNVFNRDSWFEEPEEGSGEWTSEEEDGEASEVRSRAVSSSSAISDGKRYSSRPGIKELDEDDDEIDYVNIRNPRNKR